jgi:hypothetical protein
MEVIDIRTRRPTEGGLALDLLNGEDIGVEEPHIAADALALRGMWSRAKYPRVRDVHAGVGPLPRRTTVRPARAIPTRHRDEHERLQLGHHVRREVHTA